MPNLLNTLTARDAFYIKSYNNDVSVTSFIYDLLFNKLKLKQTEAFSVNSNVRLPYSQETTLTDSEKIPFLQRFFASHEVYHVELPYGIIEYIERALETNSVGIGYILYTSDSRYRIFQPGIRNNGIDTSKEHKPYRIVYDSLIATNIEDGKTSLKVKIIFYFTPDNYIAHHILAKPYFTFLCTDPNVTATSKYTGEVAITISKVTEYSAMYSYIMWHIFEHLSLLIKRISIDVVTDDIEGYKGFHPYIIEYTEPSIENNECLVINMIIDPMLNNTSISNELLIAVTDVIASGELDYSDISVQREAISRTFSLMIARNLTKQCSAIIGEMNTSDVQTPTLAYRIRTQDSIRYAEVADHFITSIRLRWKYLFREWFVNSMGLSDREPVYRIGRTVLDVIDYDYTLD